MSAALFGISGFKNSGKTTLTAKLIETLVGQGLRVSTIKHAHHAFNLDQPGTDTDQHRSAGAQEVAIVSSKRWAIMHEMSSNEQEPSLNEIARKMAGCDLILVEGYKRENHPKLLLVSNQTELDMLSELDNIVAVAAPLDLNIDTKSLPRFDRNDAEAISRFIVENHLAELEA